MNGKTRNSLLLVCFALLASLAACDRAGPRLAESRTDRESVKLGAAKSVSVKFSMGAGDLKVKGGAAGLMDGTFTYNVPTWKPRVAYSESGDRGSLTIEQPEGSHDTTRMTRYSWDVLLNNSRTSEIRVEMGAGNSNLDLGDIALTNLRVDLGAGTSVVDLVGNWKHDVEARIEAGVGNVTVRLPRNVGVRVLAEGGIGTISAPAFSKAGGAWVNDAYGKSPVTVNVNVQGGVGRIVLELGGGPTV
jgi:uncharacterized protein YciU (UPF0263 family)